MDQGGVTWIVTADATEARVFAERVRTGPLREVPALRMAAADAERHADGGHDPAHTGEARFLKRVANALMIAAGRGEFDRLALMGPPHALGALRKALPDSVASRIDVSDAHARREDDAEALRIHLREARARTWRRENTVA